MRNINQRLVEITPDRTLEAIKGVRKSTRYRELLASLEQQEADSSELQFERTPSDPGEGAPDDISDDPTPASPDSSVEWAGPVRDAIYHLGVPDGIDINAISPGKPTTQTRAMLDSEYAWRFPPLAGPNRRPPGRRSGAPRVRTGQPGSSARARRKAAYARTQRLFRTSRQRCARNVLSGTWEVEPTPVPMALQEPYWRGVFQQIFLRQMATIVYLLYGKVNPSVLIASFLVGILPYGPFPWKRSKRYIFFVFQSLQIYSQFKLLKGNM